MRPLCLYKSEKRQMRDEGGHEKQFFGGPKTNTFIFKVMGFCGGDLAVLHTGILVFFLLVV